MREIPAHRTQSYGTVMNFWVKGADRNGVPVGAYAKAPQPVGMGSRKDSLLLSSGHLAPYQRNLYNGGDFYQVTTETRVNPGSCDVFLRTGPGGGWYSSGPLFPAWAYTALPAMPSFGAIRSIMVPLGTKGWNRFKPGKPIASVSQFIGELRQLPKNPFRLAADMVKAMRRNMVAGNPGRAVDELRRAVGDHYLNYSFGWRPFLADLEKIADYDQNLVRAMQQLRRDNGKTVRRSGTIESDTSTTSFRDNSGSSNGYMECPWWSGNSGASHREVTITTEWRCWFSAGFVYHLPRESDANSLAPIHRYLRGGGINPSIVWELTPWSWLADYFTNVGDVLDNWEASRSLALAAKYCYVMYNKKVTVTSSHSSRMWKTSTGESWSGSSSATSRQELKARTWASPYGLGFTSGNLNDSQKANLVALGMSRRI